MNAPAWSRDSASGRKTFTSFTYELRSDVMGLMGVWFAVVVPVGTVLGAWGLTRLVG